MPDRLAATAAGKCRERRCELAEPGEAPLEGQTKAQRARLGACRQRGIVGLREVDESPVVAEVQGQQLRVAIQAEAANDQSVEVPGEEIGEVERARLFVGELGECRAARVDLVAMRALEPCHALSLEHAIEHPAGSTIGIRDEDAVVAISPGAADLARDRVRNAFRPVVEGRREAREIHRGQARAPRELHELGRKRPTSDDQRRPARPSSRSVA